MKDQFVVGPHEGRELELMMAGRKPLSMFVEPCEPEFEYFPEGTFDELVSRGLLRKRVSIEALPVDGQERKVRRILYALPQDEWRIDAMLFVQALYRSFGPGWRADLERVIGLLLGYEREDIEGYVRLRAPDSPSA